MKKKTILSWLGAITAAALAITLVTGYRNSVEGMVKRISRPQVK